MKIEMPFRLRNKEGTVTVSVIENESAASWGFSVLAGRDVSFDSAQGFPVCTASINYEGQGYDAFMGWIQILQYRVGEDASESTEVDLFPQMSGTDSPFFVWGYKPTLFDAPCMLSDDRSATRDVDWKAYSFLVTTRNAVMNQTVIPLICFSWGYRTDNSGLVTIIEPSEMDLTHWSRFEGLLTAQFPKWTFDPVA